MCMKDDKSKDNYCAGRAVVSQGAFRNTEVLPGILYDLQTNEASSWGFDH